MSAREALPTAPSDATNPRGLLSQRAAPRRRPRRTSDARTCVAVLRETSHAGADVERVGDPVGREVAYERAVVDRAVLDAAVLGLEDDELPRAAVAGGVVRLLAVIDGDLPVAAAVDDEERAGDVLRHVLQREPAHERD